MAPQGRFGTAAGPARFGGSLPENPQVSTIIHVRLAGPLNSRGAMVVISPTHKEIASDPNLLQGHLATQRILTHRESMVGIRSESIWPYLGFDPGAFAIWIGEITTAPRRK